MDLAKPDQYGKKWGIPAKSTSQLDFDGTPIEVYLQTQEISETGTRGNPLEASSDRGKKMVDQVITRLVSSSKYSKMYRFQMPRRMHSCPR